MSNFFLQNGSGSDYGMGPVNPEYHQHPGPSARHGAQSAPLHGHHGAGPSGDLHAIIGILEARIRQLEQQVEINRAVTQNSIDRMEAKVEQHTVALATRSSPPFTAPTFGATAAAATGGAPGASPLPMPDPLPQYTKEEASGYGRFWTLEKWTTHAKKRVKSGDKIHKLEFLCGADGEAISKADRKEITKKAYEVWTEIYAARRDPTTWSKASTTVKTFFARSMEHAYPEFKCKASWKADAFATVRYPDWSDAHRGSGELRRDQPSIQIIGTSASVVKSAKKTDKRKTTVKQEGPPRKKLKLHQRALSPGSDLDDMQAATQKEDAAQSDSDSGPAAGSDDEDGYIDAQTRSSSPLVSVTGDGSPRATSQPATSEPREQQDDSSPERLRSVHDNGKHKIRSHAARPEPSRAPLNPLENLIVPKSTVVVVPPVVVPMPDASAKTKKPKTTAKPMVPHATWTTPRNLYARDYLKDHPDTTTNEFKKIWDNIAPEIAAEYERKSAAISKPKNPAGA